jgi:hypothetical protein
MANTGWKRELGTSKAEQYIVTPKKIRELGCGCKYQGKQLLTMCDRHYQALKNAAEFIAQEATPSDA